jgi:surfeit locus 1 family protein
MMLRRLPFWPTLLVGMAVAAMLLLGGWQLQRAQWKAALIAQYARNAGLPPVSFPRPPVGEALLFRRSSVMCLEPVSWRAEAGIARSGVSGWRHLVACRTGAEGPGATIDLGVSNSPKPPSGWRGGRIDGLISSAPNHSSLLAKMSGRAPPDTVLLIANQPAPGLLASRQPSPAELPNNHLSYAVQWFIFAGLALLIYLLALRRRLTAQG